LELGKHTTADGQRSLAVPEHLPASYSPLKRLLNRIPNARLMVSNVARRYFSSGTRMVPMLRGKDALSIEDFGTHLTITAKLADGAQLGRRDQWVFKRQTTLRRKQDGVHYRIAVSIRDAFDEQEFPAMARSAKLNGELDGFEISVEDGILRVVVPIVPELTRHWTKARQGGTSYKVVHFTLPTYWRLGSVGPDGRTPVEICVSRWTPQGAKQLPAWVVNERR